ncbi:MAG: Cysteine desulfurase, partial [Alphaproteobacteria bacterium MarineAlpha3_Bin5]
MNVPAFDEGSKNDNFGVEQIRKEFPILSAEVYGKPLVYLDNGASAQKPKKVVESMVECLEKYYSNVHRGAHFLSQRSTEAFEDARAKIAKFINAPSVDEVIFTRGATESINLVASSYGSQFLDEGDEIILSCMEHHSNIVPWQNLRDQKGIVIKIAPIDDNGNFLVDEFEKLLSDRTRLVSILHVSNVLGTIVPVRKIIELAHKKNAKVLIDGCQAVPHMQVDLSDLGADFYVFSGHKLYGPTGIGVLWAPSDILNSMPPYQS